MTADGSKSRRRVAPGPLTTIARVQRSEQVRLQIEQAIRRGDFEPGERLPSERELVETFGVSRVSVREAIRSLEALGIVKVQQGRGAFVSDRRSGLGEPMARWLQLHRDEVLELHRVRGALDELAAQSAAERSDREAVELIARAHERLRDAVETGAAVDELILIDIDFHLAIAEASGNRLLYDLLHDLHTYLAQSRLFVLSKGGRPPRSVGEHGEILDAIAAGDSTAARQAASRHIASIRELVIAGLADGMTSGPGLG
jgi:DNA-binding FadR family transcriptional regulator